jgi:hypothetical protein
MPIISFYLKTEGPKTNILFSASNVSGRTKFFKEVFEKYGFLIGDLKQRSNNLSRLRTIDFLKNLKYVFLKNK